MNAFWLGVAFVQRKLFIEDLQLGRSVVQLKPHRRGCRQELSAQAGRSCGLARQGKDSLEAAWWCRLLDLPVIKVRAAFPAFYVIASGRLNPKKPQVHAH